MRLRCEKRRCPAALVLLVQQGGSSRCDDRRDGVDPATQNGAVQRVSPRLVVIKEVRPVRDELDRPRRVPLVRRQQQRGAALPRGLLLVGAGVEEEPDDRRRRLLIRHARRGPEQRRPHILGFLPKQDAQHLVVGAVDDLLHAVEVCLEGGEHQRRHAPRVLQRRVRARLQQEPRIGGEAREACPRQRRPSLRVRSVHLRAAADQQAHHVFVAHVDGQEQRRDAVLVVDGHVRAFLQQLEGGVARRAHDGVEERRPAIAVAGFNAGAVPQQQLHQRLGLLVLRIAHVDLVAGVGPFLVRRQHERRHLHVVHALDVGAQVQQAPRAGLAAGGHGPHERRAAVLGGLLDQRLQLPAQGPVAGGQEAVERVQAVAKGGQQHRTGAMVVLHGRICAVRQQGLHTALERARPILHILGLLRLLLSSGRPLEAASPPAEALAVLAAPQERRAPAGVALVHAHARHAQKPLQRGRVAPHRRLQHRLRRRQLHVCKGRMA
eukprot:scaffold380_cov272-Pinguiococcus_pyrenoidosus.AAC.19